MRCTISRALSWTFAEPSGWAATREPSAHLYGELFDEQAIVHGPTSSGFYLRANIRIPVVDADQILTLTVWVSIGGDDFERAHQLWNDPRRVTEPPYLAELCNRIPGYPDTWHLPATVHRRNRSVSVPWPSSNRTNTLWSPIRRRGITVARAWEIAEAFEASMASR